jgi:hypothetical protein
MVTDMRNELLKLVDCGLTSNQVIYAIKIFIQPMAEFAMRNSIVSRDGLKALDDLSRKVISGTLDIKGLQKNFYYARTKDGGLGLTNLHDRYLVCKIVGLAHLCTSEIKDEVQREIEYVAEKRNVSIKQEEEGPFFNWEMDENYKIYGETNGCYDDIHEAFIEVKQLQMSMYYSREGKLRLSNGEEKFMFDSKEDSVKLLSKIVMDVNKNVKGKAQRKMKLCGGLMKTLKNNRHSNFMLNYCRAPINNSLMKFMIKARAGLIMTPERKYQIGLGDVVTRECKCDRGGFVI